MRPLEPHDRHWDDTPWDDRRDDRRSPVGPPPTMATSRTPPGREEEEEAARRRRRRSRTVPVDGRPAAAARGRPRRDGDVIWPREKQASVCVPSPSPATPSRMPSA